MSSRVLTPPIRISSEDHQKLTRLVSAYSASSPDVAEYLGRELERARIVKTCDPDVVNIGSWVTFRDEATRRERTVQLVYPHDADIAQQRISVMTPIGAALVGMAAGKTITFYTRDHETRDLSVLAVSQNSLVTAE